MVRGDLIGSGDQPIGGNVEFRMRMIDGQTIDRRLVVNVNNAPPQQEVLIKVNNNMLMRITPDQLGNASVLLRTPEFINSSQTNGAPLLDDVPDLQPGNVVRVGNASAEMELKPIVLLPPAPVIP